MLWLTDFRLFTVQTPNAFLHYSVYVRRHGQEKKMTLFHERGTSSVHPPLPDLTLWFCFRNYCMPMHCLR